MDELIKQFKNHWYFHYPHISMELTDEEIEGFINRYPTIARACDGASDYLLANDLSEVEE
jgi:hypothetical protein